MCGILPVRRLHDGKPFRYTNSCEERFPSRMSSIVSKIYETMENLNHPDVNTTVKRCQLRYQIVCGTFVTRNDGKRRQIPTRVRNIANQMFTQREIRTRVCVTLSAPSNTCIIENHRHNKGPILFINVFRACLGAQLTICAQK